MTGSETATGLAPRGPRVSRAALVVVALIVVSTTIRFAAAQAFTTPWIAPDEMVYGMLGEGLWSHGTLTLRSFPSPYYSLLTPALIGAPLSAFDLADGIQWARLLQALAMSLVALPTYLWARRLGSRWWAVAAAALVLTAPAFHYSGFLMTEPLTLTVVTVALLMLARALEEPSMWRYGVFVAWATAAAAVRLQALVLLPAFLLAALVDAVAARDRARLRPLLSFGALAAVATGLVLVVMLAIGDELSVRRVLGAYTPVGEATGVTADRLGEVAWHAFDVSVLGLGVTVLAAAALAWLVLSGRDRDPALRAFVSTTLAYAVLLVVQVGLFAAVFVGTIAERYLITLLPLLAVALCAWVARGAPRVLRVVVPVWLLVVAGAALVPIDQLAAPVTLPNTPTPAALVGLGSEGAARLALVVGALVAGALIVAVPRRLAWVIPARSGRRARGALGGLRPPDCRCVGARGTGGDRVGSSRVARRRRPGRCDAARDGGSALDGDRPHDLLEPRDRAGVGPRTRHDPLPTGRRLRRAQPRWGVADGDRRAARPAARGGAIDDHARRRQGRGAPGRGQRGARPRRVAAGAARADRASHGGLPAERGLHRHGARDGLRLQAGNARRHDPREDG